MLTKKEIHTMIVSKIKGRTIFLLFEREMMLGILNE
jgi:hypothetical protein